MSINIHNIGFYRLEPKAICCMSYENESKRLAVSRSNANIEIWNLAHAPFVEYTIYGAPGDSIEAISWYKDRLFSAGLKGMIIEYDMSELRPKYNVPVTSGAAWCMDIEVNSNRLAVGTEAGYVNVFTINNDSEQIVYEKLLDKQEGRVLCVRWASDNRLVTGGIDAIRVWNVTTGHALYKMVPGRTEQHRETLVWCVEIAENSVIVAGDSRGTFSVWDISNGERLQSQQTHRADILSVCLSKDRQTVYCSGVDPVVASFSRVKVRDDWKWIRGVERRLHEHDVRCLVLADENKLCSGGVDGYLTVSSYPPRVVARYPPNITGNTITVASSTRTVLLRYHTHLELWLLDAVKTIPSCLLTLRTKASESVVCAAIAYNGQFIVYSTNTRLRFYLVNYIKDNQEDKIKSAELSRLHQIPSLLGSCFHSVWFANSNNVVLVSQTGYLYIVSVSTSGVELLHSINTKPVLGNSAIRLLEISPCGKYIAAAGSNANVIVWRKSERDWEKLGSLPHVENNTAVTSMMFVPVPNVCLTLAYSDHQIIQYDIKQLKCKSLLTVSLPRAHPVRGLMLAPPESILTKQHGFLIHTDAGVYKLSFENNGEEDATIDRSNRGKIPKIFTSIKTMQTKLTLAKKYKHLIHAGWLTPNELLAVEVTPLLLTEQLPPCLATKQYGLA